MILIRIKMLKLNLITIFLLCINFESPVHACTGDVVCIFPEPYSCCHGCVLTDNLKKKSYKNWHIICQNNQNKETTLAY